MSSNNQGHRSVGVLENDDEQVLPLLMVTQEVDLRAHFFGASSWFPALEPHLAGHRGAWLLAKGPLERTLYATFANRGLAFALNHGLEHVYRTRFAGIPISALSHHKALSEKRSATFPISEILNELIVTSMLEQHGWAFVKHEPDGHRLCRGDWQFAAPGGKQAFVEVKSLSENIHYSGVFNKPSFAPRLKNNLKHAYSQLPKDERSTVVVLVSDGDLILDIPRGIQHADLFQAFFGDTVVSFEFDGSELHSPRLTSTFRDTFVQPRKNRRLGAVFGFAVRC